MSAEDMRDLEAALGSAILKADEAEAFYVKSLIAALADAGWTFVRILDAEAELTA